MTTDLSVTSTLSLFDTTKEQRQLFASLLMDAIESGEADPLKVHYQLKCIEKIIELLTDGKSELSKRYKKYLLDEAAKYGREFTFGNSEIQVKEFGVKYDYSACGDDGLLKQMEVYEAMGAAIKAKQEFLKTLPSDGLNQLIDDGEIIHLNPPTKTSTTGVQITLK